MQNSAEGRERGLHFTRRDLIKTGVFAGAAVAVPVVRAVSADNQPQLAESKLPKPFTVPFGVPPIAQPVRSDASADYYRVDMRAVQAEVLPGFRTLLFAYNGSVPGPTIKARQGRATVVRFVNNLPPKHPILGYETTASVHLHGGASLPQYDGYASDLTPPGFYKDYHYANEQNARGIWYHDHAHEHTAENAYYGLAGQYHITDAEESALPLPTGDYDVPLTIGDAIFQPDGNLLFSLDNANGQWGNVILVNGRPWPVMKVARRKYRFRIVAAALSRGFDFSLSTGDSYQVVMTDAGLMPKPVTVTSHQQVSGERYSIVIDFAKYKPGDRVVLRNSAAGINQTFTNTDKIMAFDVTDAAFDPTNNSVPDVLAPNNDVMNTPVSASVANRNYLLHRSGGLWKVNGHGWHDVVASNYTLVEHKSKDGTFETWTAKNGGGGWFHPFHAHLNDCRILSRNGKPPRPYEVGPKDTIFLDGGDEVQLLMDIHGAGKYMVHCHNIIHEDHDMMTQYEVVSDHRAEFSPFAAPSRPLSSEATDPL
jgi:spore coat protein A